MIVLRDEQQNKLLICCFISCSYFVFFLSQISAVFEYGSILKVKVEFKEVAVADRQAGQFAFAYVCDVAGTEYPQGLGNTKKKAKTTAARIAMDMILERGLNIPGEQVVICAVCARLLAAFFVIQ